MKAILTKGLLAGALVAAVGCNTERLHVPNFQNVTVAAATSSPASAIPLLATGIVRDHRAYLPGFIQSAGILGRESYSYSATENRPVTGNLSVAALVNTNTAAGDFWTWTGLRDIYQMRGVANSAATGIFTAAQLSAINGFLDTWEGLQLYYTILARTPIGIPIDIEANPAQLSPWVATDSVYKFIVGTLTKAQTELANGGAAFPFTLHTGFTGFNTPATFAQFTSAILARVEAEEASLGVGGCAVQSTTCYQAVLAALKTSFINPAGSLYLGPFQIYSTAAGDLPNNDAYQQNPATLAHYKIDSGVVTQPNGNLDQRFLNKVTKLAAPVACSNTSTCVATTWRFSLYNAPSDPIWIIRNEELILLRAEAEYFTNDQADALADINLVRTTSGKLAPRGAFTGNADFINELLYNRRESLMMEGHQWFDKIRFGLLNTLPIDPIPAANDILLSFLVIPQAECASRSSATGIYKPPATSGC